MEMEEKSIDIPALFGENLKKQRKLAGLTQEQLSEKLEITQKHLSMLETGAQFASATLISKICTVLNIEPSKLFETEFSSSDADKLFSRLATFFRNELNRTQSVLINRIEEIKSVDSN